MMNRQQLEVQAIQGAGARSITSRRKAPTGRWRSTELEQEYLLAARQAASRRQRTLVGASLAVSVVAIGLLIFAVISRGQAVTAETSAQAQNLASLSEIQQSVDPERRRPAGDGRRLAVTFNSQNTPPPGLIVYDLATRRVVTLAVDHRSNQTRAASSR